MMLKKSSEPERIVTDAYDLLILDKMEAGEIPLDVPATLKLADTLRR